MLLQQLAAMALGDCTAHSVRRCGLTIAAVVLLMCAVVDRMQRAAAAGGQVGETAVLDRK